MQQFKEAVNKIRQMVAMKVITPDQGEQAIATERAKVTQNVTGVTTAITGQSAQAANLFRTQLAGTAGDKSVMLSKRQLKEQQDMAKSLAKIEKKEQIKIGRALLH